MPTRLTAPAVLILIQLVVIFAAIPALTQTRTANRIPPYFGYSGIRFLPSARSGVDEKSPMSVAADSFTAVAESLNEKSQNYIGAVSSLKRKQILALGRRLSDFIDSFPTGLFYLGSQVYSTSNESVYAQDFAFSDVSSRLDVNGQALILPRQDGFAMGVQRDETAKRLKFIRALNNARKILDAPLHSRTGMPGQPGTAMPVSSPDDRDKTVLDFLNSFIKITLQPNEDNLSNKIKSLISTDFYDGQSVNDLSDVRLEKLLNTITVDGQNFIDALKQATDNLINAYNDLKNATRLSITANYRHLTDGEDWSGGSSVSRRLFWCAPSDNPAGRSDFYGSISLQYQGGNYPDLYGARRQHLSGVRTGLAIYWQDRVPYLEKRDPTKPGSHRGSPYDTDVRIDDQTTYLNHRWCKQMGVELILPSGLAPHEAYDAFFRYRDLLTDNEATISVGKDAYNLVFVTIGFGYSYTTPHGSRQKRNNDDSPGTK